MAEIVTRKQATTYFWNPIFKVSHSKQDPPNRLSLFSKPLFLKERKKHDAEEVKAKSTKFEDQQQQEEKEEAKLETFQEKMKEIGDTLEILPQLQSLIDRVMDCYPKGVAPRSFIVQSAMKHIIRDSFICYTKFRREIVVVLDNLLQMPYRNCIAAFNIYKKAAVQTNELYEFYEWCKVKGLCGSYEYPLVEPIPHIQIKALESFLSGMWQLTESSSSPTSPSTSSEESPSFFTEGERQQVMTRDHGVHIKGEEFEDEEEKPLIEVEDNDDVSWETLLESSISFSHAYDHSDMFSIFSSKWNGYQRGLFDVMEGYEHADGTWKITAYKSDVIAYNPFSA
ncbi:Phosphoinositide-binding clathrin adaptor, domain 2 [Sesbania bispinosa]|nr:Phosphoinositide-binding clathrin adaptor, domain 2 [Sesbania bispinosa]